MPAHTIDRTSARERLLAAADELFYEEGVHTVGIDRVLEHAGVAKATLYSAFGSKDELIRAYLEGRHVRRQERITAGLSRFTTPRDRLLGVFDLLAELMAEPGFRGCAFANASAESQPGGVVETVSNESRAWTRALFAELAAAAGATAPDMLAGQLMMLYDGAMTAARMDSNRGAAQAARAAAAALLDTAT